MLLFLLDTHWLWTIYSRQSLRPFKRTGRDFGHRGRQIILRSLGVIQCTFKEDQYIILYLNLCCRPLSIKLEQKFIFKKIIFMK